MQVKYVSFGHHVLSQVFMRVGDRYMNIGVIKSMTYDKGLLTILFIKEDKEERLIYVPSSNIAIME